MLYSWDRTRTLPLLAASILHAHHWQDVKLGLPATTYPNLDLTNASLPILCSISLEIVQRSSSDMVTGAVALAGNAPLLRQVHLRALLEVKVVILWSEIMTLTLNNIATLRICPALVKLSVSTHGPAPLHTEPIFLHALESLECTMKQGSILEHLTLPRLHTLALTHTVGPQNALILKNCIRRSTCPLRVFSISCHGLELETLTTYLAVVSDSVSDLDLALSSMDLLAALMPMNILKVLRV